MGDYLETLKSGNLAQMGLLSGDALEQAADLCHRVEKSDVETVRVNFTDQHGILRGKALVARLLPSLFRDGLAAPSTLLLKDTSHATAFPVWQEGMVLSGNPLGGAGDILLVPDPTSFSILPWSANSAILECDVYFKSGEPISVAPRNVLRKQINHLAEHGYAMIVGLEIEFHVFEVIEDRLEHQHATMPPLPPKTRNLAQGYQFLTETRYSELEPVMDDLRHACEALNLPIRSMEVEMGPSQFEFTFDAGDPMQSARNMVLFRTAVKEICRAQGLHATFMCRPRVENAAASGWHIHQSLVDLKSGKNPFTSKEPDQLTDTASAWVAGLLDNAGACCLLTNPTVNSYRRFSKFQLAPDRIAWGWDNRGTMLRAIAQQNNPASRIENRVADPTANPYFCFASQIASGIDGLQRKTSAPASATSPYNEQAASLPANLGEALSRFSNSNFIENAFGHEFVEWLTTLKGQEWNRYLSHLSEWEQAEYFSVY